MLSYGCIRRRVKLSSLVLATFLSIFPQTFGILCHQRDTGIFLESRCFSIGSFSSVISEPKAHVL